MKTFVVKIKVDDAVIYSDIENVISNIIVVDDIDLLEVYDD